MVGRETLDKANEVTKIIAKSLVVEALENKRKTNSHEASLPASNTETF